MKITITSAKWVRYTRVPTRGKCWLSEHRFICHIELPFFCSKYKKRKKMSFEYFHTLVWLKISICTWTSVQKKQSHGSVVSSLKKTCSAGKNSGLNPVFTVFTISYHPAWLYQEIVKRDFARLRCSRARASWHFFNKTVVICVCVLPACRSCVFTSLQLSVYFSLLHTFYPLSRFSMSMTRLISRYERVFPGKVFIRVRCKMYICLLGYIQQ